MMLKVENLNFRYKGNPELLQDISFTMESGDFLAVLGNNGAGKSSLLKCLNHILKADSGRVLLESRDLLTMKNREVAQKVAFVSQTVPGTVMTVHDTVMMGRRPYMRWGVTEEDHEIIHKVMHRLDIEDMRGRFLNELSGGERQKVMLARALAQQPKLLLLDEPTSSLDIKNQYDVLKLVREICLNDGIGAIMVIHDLNPALHFCNRFLMMKNGRVLRFGGKSVVDSEALRVIYGIDAELLDIDNRKIVFMNE